MPDIAATRPAAGAPIESAWGGQVHDTLEGVQTGTATVTFSASTASGVVTVTFPRPYASPPVVVAGGASGSNYWGNSTGVTATTVGIQGRSATSVSGSFPITWIAIGTLA